MIHQASFSFPPKTEIMSIGTGNTIVEFFSGGNIVAEEVKISKKNILAEQVKISWLSSCSNGWQIGSGDETPDSNDL